MGCDIHTYAEKLVDGKWRSIPNVSAFDWRCYGMFGFLAGVRNYSDVTPISEQRGFPNDAGPEAREAQDDELDGHSYSWLLLSELLSFDYDRPMEDRRVSREIAPGLRSGRETAGPGEGKQTTYREFLGSGFIAELDRLKALGVERIVFWFDN